MKKNKKIAIVFVIFVFLIAIFYIGVYSVAGSKCKDNDFCSTEWCKIDSECDEAAKKESMEAGFYSCVLVKPTCTRKKISELSPLQILGIK